jgi:hypothetical protein
LKTNRPNLSHNVASFIEEGVGKRRLLAIVRPDKLKRILEKMLDEQEFLAPNGIRALSRYHLENPYTFYTDGMEHRVDYEPAESSTGLFGGNSNWRGPIWFPVNYLLVESLQKFHHYLGDAYQVECPGGSGTYKSLWEVALDLEDRMIRIFLKDESGNRPVLRRHRALPAGPPLAGLPLFHEYFHGDNGAGIGASHQTGMDGTYCKADSAVQPVFRALGVALKAIVPARKPEKQHEITCWRVPLLLKLNKPAPQTPYQ